MNNFEMWTDSAGKKLKTIAVIDEFDKNEKLNKTYELLKTDIANVRLFLTNNHGWTKQEPLTGGVDFNKTDLNKLKIIDFIKFNFSKYDYQLSFENIEM